MKRELKVLLQLILKKCAIRLLRKFHPEIIAITGSVGKTSTKDAVYEVLKSKFDVRKNEGNLNNEIGVPLTIIGAKNVRNFLTIFKNTFFGYEYPQILILELGADKMGDIKYLTSFIKPKIAIVTRVACSHLEQFCDLENVAKEKGRLIESLNQDGWAVLNYDDERVRDMTNRINKTNGTNKTNKNIIFYGLEKNADVIASNIKMDLEGLSFEVSYKKEKVNISLKIIGRHQVYSILAGIACGLIYGMDLNEIKNNLKNYQLPKNRTNILKGKKGSIIINDVYNANPESMRAAIDTLIDLAKKNNRKVVVLGDMLELGSNSKELHLDIGKYLIHKADVVVLAGKIMKNVFEDLKKEFAGNIYWFKDSIEASLNISNIIGEDDIILVKGSRGMKMERVVESIKL